MRNLGILRINEDMKLVEMSPRKLEEFNKENLLKKSSKIRKE